MGSGESTFGIEGVWIKGWLCLTIHCTENSQSVEKHPSPATDDGRFATGLKAREDGRGLPAEAAWYRALRRQDAQVGSRQEYDQSSHGGTSSRCCVLCVVWSLTVVAGRKPLIRGKDGRGSILERDTFNSRFIGGGGGGYGGARVEMRL